MPRFIDVYPPSDMPSHPCISSPRFFTRIAQTDSGDEQANSRWEHPLFRFSMPESIHRQATFEAVYAHWLVMRGPAHTFPFRDPLDFASVDLDEPNIEPIISGLDQQVGIGDGFTTSFQLTKTWTRGAGTYTRPIYLPVVSSVLVMVTPDGGPSADPGGWTVTRHGGVLSFATPPGVGDVVTAGYYYDNEVRFEAVDSFEGIVQTWLLAGKADLTLVGVRFQNE